MQIAERIKTLMKDRMLTQNQVAKELGVTRQAVARWTDENCEAIPRIKHIEKLASILSTTKEYILFGEGNPQYKQCPSIDLFAIDSTKRSMDKEGIYLVSFDKNGLQVLGTCTKRFQEI